MKTRVTALLLLLVPLMLPGRAHGRYIDGFNSYSSAISGTAIRAVAVQPWDGKVVIGGDFTVNRADIVQKNLARINTNGTLDTTFTASAARAASEGSAASAVHAIAIQADRSILIGGSFSAVTAATAGSPAPDRTEISRHGLARLSSDRGGLDGFTAATPADAVINAIALQPETGAIVVGGSFSIAPSVDLPAGCRNVATISDAGAILECFSGGVSGGEVNALLLQGGEVVAGGGFTGYLARLTPAGRDATFLPPALDGAVWSLALQVDEKIVVGGDFAAPRSRLARLDADGPLDTGFDDAAPLGRVSAVAVQPDGKILIGGAFDEKLARLELDGTLDPWVSPVLDGAVNAIALQPDGKLLAGGAFTAAGGKNPPLLARYYPSGTLDQTVSMPLLTTAPYADEDNPGVPSLATTYAVSQMPDGSLLVGAHFYAVGSEQLPRADFLKLNPDWSVVSQEDFPAPNFWLQSIFSILQLPDGRINLLGWFNSISAPHVYWDNFPEWIPTPAHAQLMPDGTLNPVYMDNVRGAYNDNEDSQVIMARRAPSGWTYHACYLEKSGSYVRFEKLDDDGNSDPNFDAGIGAGLPTPPGIAALALEPDRGEGEKLIVSSSNDALIRLYNNGLKDPTFTADPINKQVSVIMVREDRKILVGGGHNVSPVTVGGETINRNLLLFEEDGHLDPNWPTLAFKNDNEGQVYDLTPLTDGRVVVTGRFHQVYDADGVWKSCNFVAILDQNGRVQCPEPGSFDNAGSLNPTNPSPSDNTQWPILGKVQADGKLLVGGRHDRFDGGYEHAHLIRFSVGNWATQELSVAEDGRKVTWLRGGGGPEVRDVYFEYSPDGTDGSWQFLADGVRIPGGWEASGVDLGLLQGYDQNRYVRARAHMEDNTGSDSIIESVRIYRARLGVKQNQSIDFSFPDKTYGDADFAPTGGATSTLPVTYSSTKAEVAVVVNGKIRITGAGVTEIKGNQAGNATYNAAPEASRTLTVAKAPVTVRPDNKARAYLNPNPPLTARYTGLFPPDTEASVVTGAPQLATTAGPASPVGDYPITVDVSGLSATNYAFTPGPPGTLSVVKSCQEIIFAPLNDVTYGDPSFELTAYSCSDLPIGFTSSKTAVAGVAGNVVTIAGAGSTSITASQPGSGNVEGASPVSRDLTVHKGSQRITFPALAPMVTGDAPLLLRASSSSRLAVSYQSSEPSVAAVNGDRVEPVGVGTTVITASQEGDGNYTPAIPVSNTLTVSAEGEAPQLSVSTLASGAVTANPVLNVTGSASDASGIASLTVNGIEFAASAPLFSCAVALESGENSVSVTATDAAGNKTSRSVSVAFDATAPAIRLLAPADNSVSIAPFFDLSGTVTRGATARLAVNGVDRGALGAAGGSLSGSGYLREGMNTIEVSAELSGRSATVKRSVTLAPGKPFVAITDPPEDVRTELDSVTLRGVAGAEGGGAVTVRLDVNGTSFTPQPSSGGFQQRVALTRAGETRIRATATDESGNYSVALRNIIKVDRVPGDLNGDALVDLRDALVALKLSLGIEPVTAQSLTHGDVAPFVNGVSHPDGKIDVGDVLLILRKIVGLAEF